jgi:hypothetical protein
MLKARQVMNTPMAITMIKIQIQRFTIPPSKFAFWNDGAAERAAAPDSNGGSV